MIHLTRLRQGDIVLNADLIELIEATPDTVITLLTGKKFLVEQTPDEVLSRVVEFRRKVGPSIVRRLDPELYAVDEEDDAA